MRHFWVFLAVGVAVFSEGRSEDNSWEGIAEAKMYLKEGNLQQSLRSATQVIYRDPTNCHALKLRGNVHCLLENYESAIQDFDVVILLAPSATAFVDRAIAHIALKNYEEAIQDIDNAIALRPADTLASALREKIACKVNF